jgi:rhodanese-related sulfurtransferase
MPSMTVKSRVLEFPAAKPAAAKKHLAAKLSLETDAWDVNEDMKAGVTGFVVVDSRSPEAYAREHIKGAVSLHHRLVSKQAAAALPKGKLLVTYCTGVGCNASTKGAMKLAALGYKVKELTGGLEWWKKEGFPTEGADAR